MPSLGVLYNPKASTGGATVLLRRCLRSYRAHLDVLYFLGRHGMAVITLLWCDRGLNAVYYMHLRVGVEIIFPLALPSRSFQNLTPLSYKIPFHDSRYYINWTLH